LTARFAADRKIAEADRREFTGQKLPADMLTASGSGLDPEISPAYAALQVPRVAATRRLSVAQVTELVQKNTAGRSIGIFGERRVNVLELNRELEVMSEPPSEEPRQR
jgi:K+-transporting ATPase ATPase C chain